MDDIWNGKDQEIYDELFDMDHEVLVSIMMNKVEQNLDITLLEFINLMTKE